MVARTAPTSLDRAGKALGLMRKAVDQWLDAPDDRRSAALFVVGCQRSGTTMLIDVLRKAPQVWVHPEKSPLAYHQFRLRTAAAIDGVLWLTPADTVVFKPLCDSHLTDRLLDAHPGSQALWLYRRWPDVAASAVTKWGHHQRDVLRALAEGRADSVGWRGERLPRLLVAQLEELVTPDLSDHAGAALFWYVRNSFFHALDLHVDPRVRLVRYEDLLTRRDDAFAEVCAFARVSLDPAWLEGVKSTLPPVPTLDVPPDVAAVCDALQARLDDALLQQAHRTAAG